MPLFSMYNATARGRGFTLPELLIALVILAVIAVFAIPKVLQSQQDNRRAAVMKETYAALSDAVYNGVLRGEIRQGPTVWNNFDYLMGKLNYVRACANGLAEGCWAAPDTYGEAGQGAVVLPNGAVIAGMGPLANASVTEVIQIDWNGDEGPNADGEDRICYVICYGTGCGNSGMRPGTVRAHNGWGPSTALYKQIFSQ